MALNSPGEYSLWLSALVRQLASCGDEPRLRDLCERLLGPAHSGAALSPSPAAQLGLDARKLLKEVRADRKGPNADKKKKLTKGG